MFTESNTTVNGPSSVADPGFSRGGGVNPPVGAWTRQIFPKTAWNRKNLDARGGRASLTPPPRSANALVTRQTWWVETWETQISITCPRVTYDTSREMCKYLNTLFSHSSNAHTKQWSNTTRIWWYKEISWNLPLPFFPLRKTGEEMSQRGTVSFLDSYFSYKSSKMVALCVTCMGELHWNCIYYAYTYSFKFHR